MSSQGMDWFQFHQQLAGNPAMSPLDMYRASLFSFSPQMLNSAAASYFPYPGGPLPPGAENLAAVFQHYEACRKAASCPPTQDPTPSQIDRESDVQQSCPSSCSDVEVNNQSDAPDTEESESVLTKKTGTNAQAGISGNVERSSSPQLPTEVVSNRNYSISNSNHSSNSQHPLHNLLTVAEAQAAKSNTAGHDGPSDQSISASKKTLSGRKRSEESAGLELDSQNCFSFEHEARVSKKQRLVWTPELHARFMSAVHHIGVDKAVPKTILQLMNVEGMTRENVASHLQKYRIHLKRLAGVGVTDPIPPEKLEQVQEQAMQEHKVKQAQAQAQAMQQHQHHQQPPQSLHPQQPPPSSMNPMAMLSMQFPFPMSMQPPGMPVVPMYNPLQSLGLPSMSNNGMYSMPSSSYSPPVPSMHSQQYMNHQFNLMGLQASAGHQLPPSRDNPPNSSHYMWNTSPYAQPGMPYQLPPGYQMPR